MTGGRRPEEPTEATRTLRRAENATNRAAKLAAEAYRYSRRGSRKRGTAAAAEDYDRAATAGMRAAEWNEQAAAESRAGAAEAAAAADQATGENPHPTAPKLPLG